MIDLKARVVSAKYQMQTYKYPPTEKCTRTGKKDPTNHSSLINIEEREAEK
jgi:hypothetical protein